MNVRETRSASTTIAGERLPAFDKIFSTIDLVAYGAATWDWHRLHYDPDYARSRALPRPIIDGQMYGAVFAQAIGHWVGPRGFIEKLSLKYRSMAFAGDTLRIEGEVTRSETAAGHGLLTLAQQIINGDRVVAEAVSRVRVPL
jgi:acyl dehydratase